MGKRNQVETGEVLGALLDEVTDGVIVADGEGVVRMMNGVAGELTGWGETGKGEKLAEVFPPSREWGKEGGGRFATRLVRRGGGELPIQVNGRWRLVRDAAGKIETRIVTFRDTSEGAKAEQERRAAEARFQTLIENLPAAAYTCDAEGMITAFNSRAKEVWGREPELSDPGDRYCGSVRLYSAQDGSPISHDECWMAQALRKKERVAGEEIVVERSDGSRRTALVHAAPIFDEEGNLQGAVNILIDITDRKAAEGKLVESDRRKDEFLAMLAHELRNPLASISNAIELMGMTRQQEQNLDLRTNISRQISQMIRLIEDLLDTSRLTRGQLNLRMEPIGANEVIGAAAEATRALFQRNSQRFKITQTGEPVPLVGDSVRLTQVLVNLLNNASKFAPCGGQIELSSERWNGEAVFCVRDNGIGIDPENQRQIFEMFVQAEESTERMRSGLGIGLYLVQRIVELHGGRTEVHSEGIGCGSEFRVFLPLADAREERRAADVLEQPPGTTYRILVVDDVKDIASLFSTMLREMGHEVDYALNGITAIEKIKANPPEIVFSDISMPMMNGYTLARTIRGELGMGETVLIAISGYGQAQDKKRAFEAGFDYHLIKPAEMPTLKAIFNEIDARLKRERGGETREANENFGGG